MAITTKFDTLTLNYLTQEQYETALAGGTLNEDQLYMTPGGNGGEKIITSTSAASNPQNYAAGTIWLQYGATPPSDRADYVVEQGTSGIWTYRKWNSGIAECWGTDTRSNVASTTAWGNLYYGTLVASSWPSSIFTAAPSMCSIHGRVNGGNGWITQTTNMSSSSVGTCYVITPTSTTLSSVNLNIYAIGSWK